MSLHPTAHELARSAAHSRLRAAQSKLGGMIPPQDDLVFSLYRENKTFSA
jgi:hypothetical protein